MISELGPSLSFSDFALLSSFSLAVGHRPPLPWLHLPHFGLLKGGVTAVWERPLPFPWRLILPEQDVHLDITSLPLGLTSFLGSPPLRLDYHIERQACHRPCGDCGIFIGALGS